MDPELKTLLAALVEGQVNLAENQTELRKEMARGQDELRKEMARGHQKLQAAITLVTKRIDWFGHQVV